jgi:hypothetical protein
MAAVFLQYLLDKLRGNDMKAKHLTWLIAAALIAYTVADLQAAARPNSKKGIYFMYGLTGGAAGDLDSLDITGASTPNAYDLIEGDTAIVTTILGTAVNYYIYVFDASATDAESSPDIIRPDDYASAGVWRKADISTAIRTLSAEPADEAVGELVYFDTGNYDPNSVGTDHYAIVTATGTPGTYVPWLQSDGTWLSDSLATKAVITSDSDGINLTDADCGKIIYMTGNGEVGLPDCDADLVGCFIRVDQDDTGRDIEIVMYGDTSNDFFVLEDGTNLDANDEADIPNAANNRANFICKEANHWFVEEIKGSVTDGGAAD